MSSSKKVITLRSSDGEMFEVEESVAIQSQTIKHMIEDGCADRVIPLLNVSGEVLSKVIVYLKKHVESTASAATDDDSDKSGGESLKAWDAEFVGVEQSAIFNLIMAANYLNVKGLLDLTCQTVADMIKGKTTEEIREAFNIENDLTPEEEEEIRRKNMWLFRYRRRNEEIRRISP